MTNDELLAGFRALIDYYADMHKRFYAMCNQSEGELRHVYQFAYNDLVLMRKNVNEKYLKQLLEAGWGAPDVAATERIFRTPGERPIGAIQRPALISPAKALF